MESLGKLNPKRGQRRVEAEPTFGPPEDEKRNLKQEQSLYNLYFFRTGISLLGQEK